MMRRLQLASLRWQYSLEMTWAYLAQFTDDPVAVANFKNMAENTRGRIHRLGIQP